MKRFAHQEEGTKRIKEAHLNARAGFLVAAEQGTGKTRMVLDFLEPEFKTLVAAPAIARGEWMRQASLWAPHLHFTAADTGKKVEQWCAQPNGALVTSYNLLKHVTGKFHIVCGDESHMTSNPEAGMTRELYRIVNSWDESFYLPLSGTPALDRPDQLWSTLNLVDPGNWGDSIWWFRRRYCNEIPNEFAPSGKAWKGLRADRAEELKRRIAEVSFRVRKSDIADSLPPLLMSLRYVKAKRSKLDWDDEKSFDELLVLNSSSKLDAGVEVLLEARNSGETHMVAFTYLRQTAEQFGTQLRAAGFDVEVVTGATGPDARHAPIDRIRKANKPAVLVCNIDAVGVSLDFTFAQTAVFVEQSWVSGKTSQALGRLIRLSSKHACNCIFVVVENSKEQRQAEVFCRKQGDLDAIIAGGRDEGAAMKTLQSHEQTDEQLLAELAI